MNQKEREEQIRSLQKEIDQKKAALRELKLAWVKEECPFSVGQVIDVCGFAYEGKTMRVEKIGFSEWGGLNWKVSGPVLRKDGSDGKNEVSFGAEEYRMRERKK